jgi:hypothetical protein
MSELVPKNGDNGDNGKHENIVFALLYSITDSILSSGIAFVVQTFKKIYVVVTVNLDPRLSPLLVTKPPFKIRMSGYILVLRGAPYRHKKMQFCSF